VNVPEEELLLIFTRNPEPGKCKTRLAASIGDHAALKIYRFLLQHTASITQELRSAKRVCYFPSILENDIWDRRYYQKALQKGSNLGQRMEEAFEKGFADGYSRIIIIGSDMYDLDQSALEKAFQKLKKADYVLGPASDGGYYLLGMKRLTPMVFKNKDWGSNSVLRDTLKDLHGKTVELLPVKNDVDVLDDINDHPVFRQFIKKN